MKTLRTLFLGILDVVALVTFVYSRGGKAAADSNVERPGRPRITLLSSLFPNIRVIRGKTLSASAAADALQHSCLFQFTRRVRVPITG